MNNTDTAKPLNLRLNIFGVIVIVMGKNPYFTPRVSIGIDKLLIVSLMLSKKTGLALVANDSTKIFPKWERVLFQVQA